MKTLDQYLIAVTGENCMLGNFGKETENGGDGE